MAEDTKRRNKRQNDFVRETYDRFTMTMPKGMKEVYRKHADKHNMSLNAYINKLLEEDIKKKP